MEKESSLDGDDWQPTHRHYKGGFYRLLFEAIHTETEEKMVVYESADGRKWVRPATMFYGTLADGKPRFDQLGYSGVRISP